MGSLEDLGKREWNKSRAKGAKGPRSQGTKEPRSPKGSQHFMFFITILQRKLSAVNSSQGPVFKTLHFPGNL